MSENELILRVLFSWTRAKLAKKFSLMDDREGFFASSIVKPSNHHITHLYIYGMFCVLTIKTAFSWNE